MDAAPLTVIPPLKVTLGVKVAAVETDSESIAAVAIAAELRVARPPKKRLLNWNVEEPRLTVLVISGTI
jgi:hypothetical protein